MVLVLIFGSFFLVSSFLFFFSTYLTFPLFKNTRDEIFLHVTVVLLLFATTILITGLFAIFLPETMSKEFQDLGLMKLGYLLKIILVFMLLTTLEFSILYTNLSSNRLFLFEKYVLIVPSFFLGLSFASFIVDNDLLDTTLFFGLYMVGFLVDIMIVVLLIRLRNVREKFTDRKPEQSLLTYLMIMLIAFLVYQSADLIGLFGSFFSQDLYILGILAQLILLPVLSVLLFIQSRSIWNLVDKINFSLLLNELN